jgi:phosphoribosylamine--glycine ligase
MACVAGTLDPAMLRVDARPCVAVVMASEGYPGPYPKNRVIAGLAAAAAEPGVIVFHAGTALCQGEVVTTGGRILAVTARGQSMREAVDRAYGAAGKIHFAGAHYRRDIARRAFEVR